MHNSLLTLGRQAVTKHGFQQSHYWLRTFTILHQKTPVNEYRPIRYSHASLALPTAWTDAARGFLVTSASSPKYPPTDTRLICNKWAESDCMSYSGILLHILHHFLMQILRYSIIYLVHGWPYAHTSFSWFSELIIVMRTVPSSRKYIPSAESPCLMISSPGAYCFGTSASARFIRSYFCRGERAKS